MEQKLRIISRIKATQDGIDFIEYLKELSHDNYILFKNDGREYNDIHKGYALAIDNLITVFENCDERLARKDNSTPEHWQ